MTDQTNSDDVLARARALETPDRAATLRRDPSVQRFWVEHRTLLADAWAEWEGRDGSSPVSLDSSLLDARLREAVSAAWDDPSAESAVRDLMDPVTPEVFLFQFFDPERLADLRSYLEGVWDANIPLRPPFGILLNRGGAMLDSRSPGYLGAPAFQAFYRELLDTYMRPIARLLFPEIVGYDTQTFGFSINYKPTTETSIRPHSDASSVTLNINLNVLGEEFAGSNVDFLDRASGDVSSLTFTPGMAMIHGGQVPHTAQPITSGSRTNFVLWLYGDNGIVPAPGAAVEPLDARERWTVPASAKDEYAPF